MKDADATAHGQDATTARRALDPGLAGLVDGPAPPFVGGAAGRGAPTVETSDEITEQSRIPHGAAQGSGTSWSGDAGRPRAESCLLLLRDLRHAGLDVPPFVLESSTRIGRLSCAELGRPVMGELVLRYSSMSRQHAMIRWTPAGFVLQDSDSTNGTFVNEFRLGGVPAVEFPIKRGDHLRFGDLRFIVDVPDGAHDRAALAMVATEVPVANTNHELWLSTYYRRSIPHIESCVFGVVVLSDHKQLFAELSDIGVRSLETALADIVARRIDAHTHAFREAQGNALRVVIVARRAARIDAVTSEIAHELQLRVAEVSARHRAVTWSTSRLDPEVASRKAVSVAATGSTVLPVVQPPQPAMTELRLVHLSDLHFGAGTVSWRHDHEQVMASLVRDLERDRFAAHRVMVTGDVAFSGAAGQYELARDALQRIADAVDLPLGSVRMIPGNHDVDRAIAQTPIIAALHHHARTSPTVLDALLSEPRSRALLLEKLSPFRAFAASIDGHPPELDWRERLVVDGARIDIWGLSSVWVSDSLDGSDGRGAFAANLIVGKSQYRELARDTLPAELNLVLTHHPLEWIAGAHGRWLRSAFASAPSIHLCGHVHRQAGTAALRLGKSNNSITLVAGAGHGEQDDPAGHSYSRCVLRRDAAGWTLGWSPRLYDPERDEFRVDRSGYDLDPAGYTWFRFPAPSH